METVTLIGVTRHNPEALSAALLTSLGADAAGCTLVREGDVLHVTLVAVPERLPGLSQRVIRFFRQWRKARVGEVYGARSGTQEGNVDPAAHSYVV
jgi:hypothetical protein